MAKKRIYLSRKVEVNESDYEAPVMERIDDITDLFSSFEEMKFLSYEKLYAFGVNTENEVVYQNLLSSSKNENTAEFYLQELYRDAIRADSIGLYLIHNHPNGLPIPSKTDLTLTNNLKRGCKLLGMRLYDHGIIANRGYYSIVTDTFYE